MSAAFPFTVGDKVRRERWQPSEFIKITGIDDGESFRGKYDDDEAYSATWFIATNPDGKWVAA